MVAGGRRPPGRDERTDCTPEGCQNVRVGLAPLQGAEDFFDSLSGGGGEILNSKF